MFSKVNDFGVSSDNENSNRLRFPFFIVLKDLWGNTVFKIGLFSLLFGIPFSIPFVSGAGLFSTSFNNNDPLTSGIITGSSDTDAKAGDIRIFKYNYQFRLEDGKIFNGYGYLTGDSLKQGDEIQIFYKQADPSKSRGVNLRNSVFGAVGAVVGLGFPVFGIIVLAFGMRKIFRQISILKKSEIAFGSLLNKKATNMKIDNSTVYALTFEFTASDSTQYQVLVKSKDTYRLTDNKLEKLAYDPKNPKRFVLIDSLPEGIRTYFLSKLMSR